MAAAAETVCVRFVTAAVAVLWGPSPAHLQEVSVGIYRVEWSHSTIRPVMNMF